MPNIIIRDEINLHYFIDSCAAHNCLWQALAFVPLLMSSPLTKIGVTYTQDPQIRVIGSVEPELSTKMPRNFREKL